MTSEISNNFPDPLNLDNPSEPQEPPENMPSIQEVESDLISSRKKPKIYPQKFRKVWLDNQAFASWIQEVDDNPMKAYCVVCHVEINAKYHELKLHGKTRKHLKKVAEFPERLWTNKSKMIKLDVSHLSTNSSFIQSSTNCTPSSQVESIIVNYQETERITPVTHLLHSRISNETLRLWQCSGTEIHPHNLMLPVFVCDDADAVLPVQSLPGVYQYGVNELCMALQPYVANGLSSIMLHASCTRIMKDNIGTAANSPANPIIIAVRKLKEAFPSLTIACDLCLCPFTDHGHCGILNHDGAIDNETTVKRLSELGMAYAMAGANILAPSDMMDGRVLAIKNLLQQASLSNRVAVLSYVAKFASSLCKEFKTTLHSNHSMGLVDYGDRRLYQVPPGSSTMALKSVERDVSEGADMLLVKPGLPYLDIVRQIKNKYPAHPVFVYQVSGEYQMLHQGAIAHCFELHATLIEMLTSMRRAGADVIITHYTPAMLSYLKSKIC